MVKTSSGERTASTVPLTDVHGRVRHVAVDLEVVHAMVAESRHAQGLPPTVTDAAVLQRIALIFSTAQSPAA